MSKLRIVFMGTPDFAASVLNSVSQWTRGELIAVYSQPDRPSGRGKKLTPSPVKTLATQLGLPVFQPKNFRSDEDVQTLAFLNPDVLVVAAYGLILPQRVLDIPRLGCWNVHGSLLPQYRGAAPIQRAVMNGDTISGISIMKMEAGMDTGPVLLQQAVTIEPHDTSGSLFETLAEYGARLMVGALGMIAEGRVDLIPQNNDKATTAPKISPEEEFIDWSQDSRTIHNIIRGLTPAPGAKSVLRCEGFEDIPLRIEPGVPADDSSDFPPGTLFNMDDKTLLVACGLGIYKIKTLRPAGKSTMSAPDFYNGRLKNRPAPWGILHKK